MSGPPILRLGTLKGVAQFQEHLQTLGLKIPCDGEIVSGSESPLREPLVGGEIKIGNRIAVHPMEGWDGTADGNPSERTIRRWKRFGQSGGGCAAGGRSGTEGRPGRGLYESFSMAGGERQGAAA